MVHFVTLLITFCVKKIIKFSVQVKIMGRLFKINSRQLIFASLMGTVAFIVRNMGLYVVLLHPFKFDVRWVFSLLAACWTGPVGGFISGFLAALKFPYPLIDLACIPVHFLVGLMARVFRKMNKSSIVACIFWPIFGVPAYLAMSLLFLRVDVFVLALALAFIGVSTSVIAMVVGYAVEKRTRILELLEGCYVA